jgi:multisubunit Na+/H+ antiporter MnhE subunit
MGKTTIVILRVVIAVALLGSLAVQVLIVPLLWLDLADEELWGRIALVTLMVLGVVTLQVFGVCVWLLLTKVRRGSIFSESSFRYVNVIIGAIVAAALLTWVLAALLAPGAMAPGIVALIGGAGVVFAGMALLVVVMKALLRQAIDSEAEARALRAELDDEVI